MCAIMIWIATPFSCHSKKKRLSKIQALPIWKGENPPWNTFKSNITALGAICCVSELFFFVCVYFRGYPAKRKWDVRIFPAQPQHSLTAEHNSAIWKISTANIKFWSQSLRYESNGGFFFFFLELSFCRRGVIPPQNYSYYFLHTGTHNLKKVMRGRLRESEQTKEAKKNDCRLATPTHNFFVFAYCRLARLNRHIARERSHFNRWLAVLLFAPTSPATSHWTKGLVSLRSIGWM